MPSGSAIRFGDVGFVRLRDYRSAPNAPAVIHHAGGGHGFVRGTACSSRLHLNVYKKAYALAMRIVEITERFPPEERYALTRQLRQAPAWLSVHRASDFAHRIYQW